MKYFGWTVLTICLLFFLSVFMLSTRMCSNAEKVVYDQFKPEELLRKYEWFKDASAQLDQKVATLHTYESRFKQMRSDYGADSITRKNWAREDREQFSIWQSEYTGLKASYNSLAADYNAAMVKFNYRFTNKGDLPAGTTEPLPREYKPYITE